MMMKSIISQGFVLVKDETESFSSFYIRKNTVQSQLRLLENRKSL